MANARPDFFIRGSGLYSELLHCKHSIHVKESIKIVIRMSPGDRTKVRIAAFKLGKP